MELGFSQRIVKIREVQKSSRVRKVEEGREHVFKRSIGRSHSNLPAYSPRVYSGRFRSAASAGVSSFFVWLHVWQAVTTFPRVDFPPLASGTT